MRSNNRGAAEAALAAYQQIADEAIAGANASGDEAAIARLAAALDRHVDNLDARRGPGPAAGRRGHPSQHRARDPAQRCRDRADRVEGRHAAERVGRSGWSGQPGRTGGQPDVHGRAGRAAGAGAGAHAEADEGADADQASPRQPTRPPRRRSSRPAAPPTRQPGNQPGHRATRATSSPRRLAESPVRGRRRALPHYAA